MALTGPLLCAARRKRQALRRRKRFAEQFGRVPTTRFLKGACFGYLLFFLIVSSNLQAVKHSCPWWFCWGGGQVMSFLKLLRTFETMAKPNPLGGQWVNVLFVPG